ncbi:alpha/beta fold hydrolase [Inhella proteolytica]|uniref:Alpha/beta fold hydrolase n=1 Tax=Inhella proteolytica TaxID=2795029 RepID=A0A931NGJ8_9BURK|nr:alpha/beta fold hydrolase [Inhella proteolytica]MBH9577231.1 alpha/beta fold hydrolase [Inhella proteolytica]
MLKWMLITLAAALLPLAAWVTQRFRADMAEAYARLQTGSQLLTTPQEAIEYRVQGQGAAVLVVHGSGGGFDQGELLAEATLGSGWRLVIPSRFGYLRSSLPAQASFEAQAHAYARLLDHLGLPRVAVLAFSQGGPSALWFARLYPQRVSALVLLSAGVARSAEAAQQQADAKGAALMRLFQHDFAYWALTKALPDRFLDLMGVDAAVRAALQPAQRRLADALLQRMNPVAPRAAGARLDNQAELPGAETLAAIRAPTLVLHARDDGLQRFHNAESAARHIPGARLLAFDRGGHLLLAVENAAVRRAVAEHLQAHPSVAPPAE